MNGLRTLALFLPGFNPRNDTVYHLALIHRSFGILMFSTILIFHREGYSPGT